MTYRITGLDPALFADLHQLSDAALADRAIVRSRVVSENATPCRVTLDDAPIGEAVLLLSYDHQPADTPYQQQGPIFVREKGARFDAVGTIPPALARRPLSLRGYDGDHKMIDAELTDGAAAESLIERMLANPSVAYIHAHYARRGCYAARINRA